MDYEKKYKEALEKARQLCAYPTSKPFISDLQDIFPQLKENEDERIRNTIFDCLYRCCDSGVITRDQRQSCISWLEKQAEHANFRNKIQVGDRVTRNKDGVLVNLSQLDRVAKQGKNNMGISKATKQELKDNLDKVLSKETPESWNEFLDEQKPIGKVESKFHIDEWVVYNYPTTLSSISEIIQIDRGVIDLKDTNGLRFQTNINELNCNYHLWNISDAKAGDILAADPIEGIEGFSFSSSFVAIYKKRNGEDFDSYCFVGFDGKFDKRGIEHSTDNIHPATKEQRDLLFQKMEEAGYEWDEEEKKLEEIKYNKVKWKNHDEEIINGIRNFIALNQDLVERGVDEWLDWLKNLENKMQLKE